MARVNKYAHLTAKEREKPSFPLKWLFERNYLEGEILDYGCGHGADVQFLMERGLEVKGYDPYYRPELIRKKYDTIFCGYVLNVLMKSEQTRVLMEVSELLRFGGKAFFAVRRDIKYPGFRVHKIHKQKTYQCNVILPFKSVFRNDFCEIYQFQHFNFKIGENKNCPFCSPEERRPLSENIFAYAIPDKYPVSKGHSLVIPKRHCSNYFDLFDREKASCSLMIDHLQKKLEREYKPDGFNVGININKVAGQTIFHSHIHVIPRYNGDTDDPTGGVRKVVDGHGNYLTENK